MFRKVSRDDRQILDRTVCDEILERGTSGVLNVLGDDDYPYGVPLSYVYDGQRLYFHCMPSGHKWDAIQKHEKVSFTVIDKDQIVPEEYTSYFRSVIVFGRARIVEDMDEKLHLHDLLVRKYSPDFLEGVYEKFKDRIAWMGAFVVEIDHVSGKEAIELAVPGWILDELKTD